MDRVAVRDGADARLGYVALVGDQLGLESDLLRDLLGSADREIRRDDVNDPVKTFMPRTLDLTDHGHALSVAGDGPVTHPRSQARESTRPRPLQPAGRAPARRGAGLGRDNRARRRVPPPEVRRAQ